MTGPQARCYAIIALNELISAREQEVEPKAENILQPTFDNLNITNYNIYINAQLPYTAFLWTG